MADVDPPRALNAFTAAARTVLEESDGRPVAATRQGELDIEVRFERDMLWIEMRRNGEGGLALRMPVFSPDCRCVKLEMDDALAAVGCRGSLGTARLVLRGDPFGLEQIRATLEFTPARDLAIEWLPRDLVPFDGSGDPAATEGEVEAAQRKLNTGLLYFLEAP